MLQLPVCCKRAAVQITAGTGEKSSAPAAVWS